MSLSYGDSLAQDIQRLVLFEDDFEDNVLDGWLLADDNGNFIMGDGSPWQILVAGGNYYLKGRTHSFAEPTMDGFMDGSVELKFKLGIDALFHFNVRENEGEEYARYFIGIHNTGIYLSKQDTDNFYDLSAVDINLQTNYWHILKIVLENNIIQIYINNFFL